MKRCVPTILLVTSWSVCSLAGEALGEKRLQIVTFNAQCLAAPGKIATRIPRFRWRLARINHLERVASVIETLEPDIFNLVEVTSSETVQQVVRILHEKGLEDYRGYHAESADRFSGFDVALISRIDPDLVKDRHIRCIVSPPGDSMWRESYEFTDEQGRTRSRDTAINRNGVYYVTVDGLKLGFLGVHFKSDPSSKSANARRTAESVVARRIIHKEIVGRGYLPIVLGDLNDYDPDVPDRDASRQTMTTVLPDVKNYDRSKQGAKLVNVAERISRVADRFTSHWDRNENGVADSDDVYTMIDHILLPMKLMPLVHRVFVCRCVDLNLQGIGKAH